MDVPLLLLLVGAEKEFLVDFPRDYWIGGLFESKRLKEKERENEQRYNFTAADRTSVEIAYFWILDLDDYFC